jgi:hypothetical protein
LSDEFGADQSMFVQVLRSWGSRKVIRQAPEGTIPSLVQCFINTLTYNLA